MMQANKKYNERQNVVNQNRMAYASKRNVTVDGANPLINSNSQLEYAMGGTMTSNMNFNQQSKIRMQSAQARALDRINDSEEIQVKLEEVQEKINKAEIKKIDEL